MGGKKKQTVGYKYYLGQHLILSHGPIDNVSEIIADDKIAFVATNWTGGSIQVNSPNLFGGEDGEGGISGKFDLDVGGPTQTANSYLVSKLSPELVPSFRGVAGVVLNQVYIGTQAYLKKLAFKATRIHKTKSEGLTQWYDEKSELLYVNPKGGLYTFSSLTAHMTPGYNTSEAEVVLSNNETIAIEVYGGSASAYSLWPDDDEVPVDRKPWRFTLNVSKDGAFPTSYYPTEFDTPTDAANAASVEGPIILTGPGTFKVYLWDGDGEASNNRGALTFGIGISKNRDMNPAHIIRECLTNPDWGMGYQDADIDDASFTVAADKLYAETMGMSLLWNRQNTIDEFISEITKHIDASVYVDKSTGKFKLKLVRFDYNVDDLISLNPSNISHISDFTRPSFGELTNSITVKYYDGNTGKDSSVTIQDIALSQMQGVTINTTAQYPGFTNASIAARVAQRDLKTLSTPIASCTIYANRDAYPLSIGDVFKLTWPDYGIIDLVMRATALAYGDGKSNQVRISCTEDVYALPANAIIVPTPPVWVDPSAKPAVAQNRLLYEVPYLEAIQQNGQAAVDAVIAIDPEIGYVGSSVGRPSGSSLYANMYVNSGGGYTNNATVDFSPTAKLVSDIGKMTTSFSISETVDIANAPVGTWFQIDNELMSIVSYVDPVLTVKRGILDTVPENHSINSVLYFWDNYSVNDETQYVDGESLNIKITPVTGQGELPLLLAPVDTLEIKGRLARPYPPANFKINDEYFPNTAEGSLILTWSHRDRSLQTSNVYLDFTDNSIGPEPGTLYNVRVYENASNTLVYSNLAISGLSDSVTVSAGFTARVELESERSALTSYQKLSHIIELISVYFNFSPRGLNVPTGAAKLAKTISSSIYAIQQNILTRMSNSDLSIINTVTLDNNITGLSVDGTSIFVSDKGTSSVLGKLYKYSNDFSTTSNINLPTYGDGKGLTFVAGSLWVSLPTTGVIRRINPSDLSTVANVTIAGLPCRLTNDGTYVYCVDSTASKIYKIDPATNTIVLTINISSAPVDESEIAVANSLVFVSQGFAIRAYDVNTGAEYSSGPIFLGTSYVKFIPIFTSGSKTLGKSSITYGSKTIYEYYESSDNGQTFNKLGAGDYISSLHEVTPCLTDGTYISFEIEKSFDSSKTDFFITKGLLGSVPSLTTSKFSRPYIPVTIGSDGSKFIAVTTGNNVYTSTDGTTWTLVGNITTIGGVYTQDFGSSNYGLAVSLLWVNDRWFIRAPNGLQLYYTTDVNAVSGWILCNLPISVFPQFNTIAVHSGNLFASALKQESGTNIPLIIKSTDNGSNWTTAIYPLTGGVSSLYNVGGDLIGVEFGFVGKTVKSTDGGTTWVEVSNGIPLVKFGEYPVLANSNILVTQGLTSTPPGESDQKLIYTSNGTTFANSVGIDIKASALVINSVNTILAVRNGLDVTVIDTTDMHTVGSLNIEQPLGYTHFSEISLIDTTRLIVDNGLTVDYYDNMSTGIRIIEDGNTRITESGDIRILES